MKDIFYTVFKYKDKKSPDKLGLYPERVHTRAFPERRYLWSSRMLVVVATVSISVNMILASLFILLIPQKTADPRFLQVDKSFYTLKQTQPLEKNVLATDLLAESEITDYIKLRFEITQNAEDDTRRWDQESRFYWISSQDAYANFMQNDLTYANIQRNKGVTRDVKIQWVEPIGVNLWQAQFLTYDYLGDRPPQVFQWRAVIRISYRTLNYKTKEDMIKNPYGFRVESFYLSYAGKPQ